MDWILRLKASQADESLKREFELWLDQSPANRAAYRSVAYTWASLGGLPKPAASAAPAEVIRLPVRKSHRLGWLAGAALAAACLALIAVPALQRHMLADYATSVAELREISLPDGSLASLDADSAIAVNYREGERSVTLLDGQVFFQVLRDREHPFIVKAGEVSVMVTGTAFSVAKTADAISVAVASGSVDVAVRDGERNGLTQGDRLTFDRHDRTAIRGQVPPSHVGSWRSRQLVVHEATVGELVEELGRHQGGVIIVRDKSLNRQRVSGVFDLTNPHEALNTLAASQGATLRQFTPYVLVISSP